MATCAMIGYLIPSIRQQKESCAYDDNDESDKIRQKKSVLSAYQITGPFLDHINIKSFK